MGEFEEKLNALLSNPDALSQVMNLAQSLDLGGGSGGGSGGPPPEGGGPGGPAPSPPPEGNGGPNPGNLGGLGDLAGLGNLLGQVDPKLISRLLPLVSELTGGGGGGDERAQLLYALRPFLKPERQEKVERAMKAARLIHVGKKLLTSLGDGHV